MGCCITNKSEHKDHFCVNCKSSNKKAMKLEELVEHCRHCIVGVGGDETKCSWEPID